MEKTNVAVIGLGGVSQIMHLPILHKMKNAEIIAVCDSDQSKAKHVARKYSVKKYFTDTGELLSDVPEIDAVIVATTTDTHADISVRCLDAGKHVLVEKPIARNLKETRQIVDASVKNRKILAVGMNNRFRMDSILSRNFVRNNELGDVFYVKTGWLKTQSSNEKWFSSNEKAGGGVFIDNGIVMLDLGMWMLGFPEVKSVSSINYYHNTKKVEDSNFTLIKFRNGSSLTIEVSWSLVREGEFFYCNVFGTSGSSSINPLHITKRINGQLYDITPKNIRRSADVFRNSFENELAYFLGAIQGTHTPISTGKEALKVMELVDSVYKSAKAGREILFK